MPDGTGVWFGVNQKTFEAGHFARAAMEGVTLGMNYGLRRLAELGVQADANPRHRRRRQIQGLAADHGRRLQRGSRHAESQRRRGLRRGLAGALVLAPAAGREGLHQRHHRPVRGAERRRNGPSRIAKNAAVYRELQGIQDEMSASLRDAFKRHRQFLLR